ncbi:hypothetical protein AC578_10306 [Pseudocercospora eumusae]|uniref:Peptidase M12A domain-containing protein n=1 Tax=Pseudocercospora eumusae TaxID=321146 RepID=A0A139HRN7_9PEZI|nr:hypothetical protein AC578_10306 [Pseudocercospora eumusae]
MDSFDLLNLGPADACEQNIRSAHSVLSIHNQRSPSSRTMKAFLTSLLFFTGALCLPIDNPAIDTDTTLSKRWFSVPELPGNPNAKVPGVRYPWPHDKKEGIQKIRYCFRDQRSATALADLFEGPVIQKWQRAGALYPNTNLKIIPDPRCTPSKQKFAEQVAQKWNVFDALVISEATAQDSSGTSTPGNVEVQASSSRPSTLSKGPIRRSDSGDALFDSSGGSSEFASDSDPPIVDSDASEGEPGTGGNSFSTTGYSNGLGNGVAKKFPNTMTIRNAQWRDEGHTIGLAHEHQRSDRDRYLHVNFRNIQGYAKARDKVSKLSAQEYPQFGTVVDPDQRMAIVTKNADLAEKLDFKILEWIAAGPGSNLGTEFDHLEKSPSLDLNSIMLYGSFTSAESGITSELRRDGVLLGLDDDGKPMLKVTPGGSINFAQAGPSEDDVARVKQLYPLLPTTAGSSTRTGSPAIAGPSGSKSGKIS